MLDSRSLVGRQIVIFSQRSFEVSERRKAGSLVTKREKGEVVYQRRGGKFRGLVVIAVVAGTFRRHETGI